MVTALTTMKESLGPASLYFYVTLTRISGVCLMVRQVTRSPKMNSCVSIFPDLDFLRLWLASSLYFSRERSTWPLKASWPHRFQGPRQISHVTHAHREIPRLNRVELGSTFFPDFYLILFFRRDTPTILT